MTTIGRVVELARRVGVGKNAVVGFPPRAIPSTTDTMSLGKGPHCSFVLLAEFDIDSGAQLTYQFPQPLGTDEG